MTDPTPLRARSRSGQTETTEAALRRIAGEAFAAREALMRVVSIAEEPRSLSTWDRQKADAAITRMRDEALKGLR